jgi:hypothetical protein
LWRFTEESPSFVPRRAIVASSRKNLCINIDEGVGKAEEEYASAFIQWNKKFPDMKALFDRDLATSIDNTNRPPRSTLFFPAALA